MKYGLTDTQLQEIIAFIEQYADVEQAILFGSRAMGTFKEASDVDIAIKGEKVTDSLAQRIKFDIEEDTYLPFFFDVIAYPSISNEALIKHIDEKGVVIFRRWEGAVMSGNYEPHQSSNWKDTKIGEILTLEYGKGLKQYQDNIGNYEVFGTNGKIGRTDSFLYDKPSLVIGRKGAYRGVHLAKNPFFVIDTAFYTKSKIDELDIVYLYYWFKCIDINSMDSGSAIPSTSRDEVYDLDISLPSPLQQKAIAAVLSSLDDKIDLLHRQNLTLEAMAETLFRQWFVEEVGEDWEDGTLGHFAVNPKNGVKPSDIDSETKYVGLEHIDRRSIALIQSGNASDVTSNKFRFSENDILFGKLRPYFHKVCFAPYSGVCSTDILVIRPKKTDYFSYCLFAFYQSDVVEYANLGSGGTRMPRTNWETLSQYPMAVPDDMKLHEFNNLVMPSINKIKQNIVQIRTLEKLRDTLLPKLMSGDVRVKVA